MPASASVGRCLPVPARLESRQRTGLETIVAMQQLQPPKTGERGLPAESVQTAGPHGPVDRYVMGACSDFPATAPQWGRSAPPSPSGALARITPPPVLAARRVCCPMTVFGSWRIVTVLVYETSMVCIYSMALERLIIRNVFDRRRHHWHDRHVHLILLRRPV